MPLFSVFAAGFLLIFSVGGCQLTETSQDVSTNTFLGEVDDFTLDEHPVLVQPAREEPPEIVGLLVTPATPQDALFQIPARERYKEVVIFGSSQKNSMPEIFPNARIQSFAITSHRQIYDIATRLAATLPPESLILVEMEPEFSADPLLQQFQKNFYDDVVNRFETEKFDELPQRVSFSLQTFAVYLKARGLQVEFETASDDVPLPAAIRTEKKDPSSLSQSSDRPAYLVFFGDIMLDRDVRNLMNKNGLDHPFQKMDLKYLKMNDFLIANLEGPIAKNAIKTGKTIAFRFMPDTSPLLKKYFFDVLSLANNHAMDMGVKGYDSSRELLRAENIVPFGDPRKVVDESVAELHAGGQKIALLGLEEVVYKIQDEKTIAKIKELTAQGYKVIVFPHWGIEYKHEPNKRQKDLAHAFIDAGAVAVIGHHPHVVQAYENYNGRPIFYSLGNAIFDQYFSTDTQEGLSLAMELNESTLTIYLLPIKIERTQMRIMNEEERKIFLEKFVSWGEHSDQAKQILQSGKIFITQM